MRNILLALSTVCAGVLMFGTPAFSSPSTVGLAALASAAKSFPCSDMMKFYDHTEEIFHASLWQTFGKRRKCWKRLFKQDKPVHLQVYGYNAICVKKNNCVRYEMFHGVGVSKLNSRIEKQHKKTLRAFGQFATRFRRLCEKNKKAGDRCYISPGLETQLTPKALRIVVKKFQAKGWYHNEIVHNPSEVSSFRGVGAAGVLEWHNSNNTRGMRYTSIPTSQERFHFTFDGADPSFCNRGRPGLIDRISANDMRTTIEHYKHRARFIGLWCSTWQGLQGDSGIAPKPRDRRFSFPVGDIQDLLKVSGLK